MAKLTEQEKRAEHIMWLTDKVQIANEASKDLPAELRVIAFKIILEQSMQPKVLKL